MKVKLHDMRIGYLGNDDRPTKTVSKFQRRFWSFMASSKKQSAGEW